VSFGVWDGGHTTAAFDVLVRQEIARDAAFAKAAGLKPN
jgi:hypothetical protein